MSAKQKLKEIYIKKYKDEKWYKEDIDNEALLEVLQECGEEVSEKTISESRWWSNTEVVTKLEDTYFRYEWATANRDESVRDLGWEFDWGTLVEVEPYEKTIIAYKVKK